MATEYQIPMFARLQIRTEWRGGRLADIDVVGLDDAAKFASEHAGKEVTVNDILRAGARGEIPLRAVARAAVTMQPCRENEKPFSIPGLSIPTLPLVACQALCNVGLATWRTYDGFETHNGELCRFVRWQIPDGEESLVTVLEDCRLLGYDVHALADAFSDCAPGGSVDTSSGDMKTHAVAAVRVISKRRDDLAPVIDRARAVCANKNDTAEVWNALLSEVTSSSPPNPFTGKSAPEGLMYEKLAGETGFFSKAALRQRLKRSPVK